MTLGSQIKTLRVKKRLTQQQLADLMDVSNKAVSKWENEEGTPDLENIKRLAQIFNVSLDTLITGEENKNEAAAHNQTLTYSKYEKRLILANVLILLLCIVPIVTLDGGQIFGFETPFLTVKISVSIFKLVGELFSNFTFGNIVIGISGIGIIGAAIANIIVLITHRFMNTPNTWCVVGGVSTVVLLIVFTIFTLAHKMSMTFTAVLLIAVQGYILAVVRKHARDALPKGIVNR